LKISKINKINLICAEPAKILQYLTTILHPKYVLDRPLHFIATTRHALKALEEEAKKNQARQSLCLFGVGTHSVTHSDTLWSG
jgi:hypothetical protein